MNIIADIAGRYNELMLLLDKMPKDQEIILLGDLNDRGPDSAFVIDWAARNKIRCVKSNHGAMMIEAYELWKATGNPYSSWDFNMNGGYQTLLSYGGFENMPIEHIEYLKNCEWYIETDDLLLSHAPIHSEFKKEMHLTDDFYWNRSKPIRRDKFQIHGHNTYFKLYTDELGMFGMCLDDSGNDKLTGIHWPSKDIYTQEYL
jgi:serine/threonine protein phosphatase 1